MNERTTEVLEQYELEVQSKRRGRGAWICETSQGLKLLREYKGTVKRLEFEEQIMNVLQNQKTCRTDQYMRNREGELLSVAEDGTRCVVKEWFSGRECSVQSEAEVVRAVGQIVESGVNSHASGGGGDGAPQPGTCPYAELYPEKTA